MQKSNHDGQVLEENQDHYTCLLKVRIENGICSQYLCTKAAISRKTLMVHQKLKTSVCNLILPNI